MVMVASLLVQPERAPKLAELLTPDLRVNGAEPEQRVVLSGISWQRYRKIDKELGRDRSVPRLYYLDGNLEWMSTSEEHERIKEWIGDLLSDFFFEEDIDVIPRGQATINLRNVGAEPDKSWCIDGNKKYPDIVLEIALSSGGVDKLEIYRHFKIPEVWIWRDRKLEVFVLKASGQYQRSRKSALLSKLDIGLLERCVSVSSWREARKRFRAHLV